MAVKNRTNGKEADTSHRNGEKLSQKQKTREGRKRNLNPAEKNIQAIAKMEYSALHKRSLADRISDAITKFSGTSTFVIIHVIWFGVWILLNLNLIPGIPAFDPFPFGLLTMIVSLEAIFLSTFVLISQNRMSQMADKRAQLDLQVNLLAEQEMTMMLQMLRRICEYFDLEVESFGEEEVQQLVEKTDVGKIMKELEEKLPSSQ
jgi:uncharacterized membrane protein